MARSFRNPGQNLGAMDADAAAILLTAAADLTLVLDNTGAILDIAFSGAEIAGEGLDQWVGQPLIDSVAEDSRSKVSATLGEVISGGTSRKRELNFVGDSDEMLPMSCVAVKLAEDDRIILFGRDMRGLARLQQRLVNTQISMEREYTRLRQAEASYRLLFQMVGEAVLIVDASSMIISDANPMAAEVLDVPVGKMVGRRATHVFSSNHREAVRAMLGSAQSVGKAELSDLTLAGETRYTARATLFRQADVSYLIVRLLSAERASADASGGAENDALAVIERLPDGFVMIDEQRRVKRANTAFIEMVQAANMDRVIDGPLDNWFERSTVDANVLLANVREHGLVRRFPTVLRGELGATEDVEITAVCVPSDGQSLYGLVLRRVSRMPAADEPVSGFPAKSAEQLTDLIGHMPLKEVVRETTDVVERLCIEAALKLTGDNRASAAQMLGVSRQSLYAKMRRFGLGDLTGPSGGS